MKHGMHVWQKIEAKSNHNWGIFSKQVGKKIFEQDLLSEQAGILSKFQKMSRSYYSKVPNKRSATFIDFRKIFQGLRSYLEGERLLVFYKILFAS